MSSKPKFIEISCYIVSKSEGNNAMKQVSTKISEELNNNIDEAIKNLSIDNKNIVLKTNENEVNELIAGIEVKINAEFDEKNKKIGVSVIFDTKDTTHNYVIYFGYMPTGAIRRQPLI